MATDSERIASLENEVVKMKIDIAVVQSDMVNVKGDITSIKDDTRWLRRAFTGAMITAGVGGVIALFFALINYVVIK